eukprot:UN01404
MILRVVLLLYLILVQLVVLIVNQFLVVPEAAICALGKMVTKPAFDKNGQVYPQTVMNIGWTADHRALDGATVARFSNEFKNYIENPHEMLLY